MNIDMLLNDVLNKALITDRIKGVPNSNNIAKFVIGYLENNKLTTQKNNMNRDQQTELVKHTLTTVIK